MHFRDKTHIAFLFQAMLVENKKAMVPIEQELDAIV